MVCRARVCPVSSCASSHDGRLRRTRGSKVYFFLFREPVVLATPICHNTQLCSHSEIVVAHPHTLSAQLPACLELPSTTRPPLCLHSQAGPFTRPMFAVLPTCPELRSAAYRILPLGVCASHCPLMPPLAVAVPVFDLFGDHRAACPRAGLLRS